MPEEMDHVVKLLKPIAEMPAIGLVSEEDAKIKVVLPILRALGYEDSDFKYEGRTGRGYVDVVADHLHTGIVIETKAPKSKLDQRHQEQLETYVFHKHGRDKTTIAILTNGDAFKVYGVIGPLLKGFLDETFLLSFVRPKLLSKEVFPYMMDLLAKQNNEHGKISASIAKIRELRDRERQLEQDLSALKAKREEIDGRIRDIESKLELTCVTPVPIQTRSEASSTAGKKVSAAINPILRLLEEKEATSKSKAVRRKWLDEQLIGKFEGVQTNQSVSFALIDLKKKKVIDYEGHPMDVWLKSQQKAPE